VTINVSDLDAATGGGWHVFKFAAPVLLLAATTYAVQGSTSVASQVNLSRDATAANWSRLLRTTTTAAPAATDVLVIAGDYTAIATFSTYTVTNDNTATTSFGKVEVANIGIFSSGVAAATAYYLKLAGNLTVRSGGILNLGTSGVPIPSSSSTSLEFACTVNVEFGIEALSGSTVNAYGNPLSFVKTKLAADAAAAATALTTTDSTGWLSGDSIAIASTTRTAADAEMKALTANAVGTALTIAAIGNAHSGTSPTQGELANLNRNVKIFGTTSALNAYINLATTSVSIFDHVEFYNLGSATANKRGINIQTTTGSALFNKCSMHDWTNVSCLILTSSTANNFTLTGNVFYLIAGNPLNISATTGTAWSITDNLSIRSTGTSFSINDLGGTFSDNTATSSAATGISLVDLDFTGTISGNVSHSNATLGFTIVNVTSSNTSVMKTIANSISYRNGTSGMSFTNSFGFLVDTVTLFGNAVAGIAYTSHCGNIMFKAITANAGVTLTCPLGVSFGVDISDQTFDSCSFGATTTHSTADVSVSASNTYMTNIVFKNCLFGSTNEIINTSSNMVNGSYIGSQKHDQIADNHKNFKRAGITTIDTTIFNSASPSSRMTPSSTILKLEDSTKKVAVNSGQTATPSVYVRKSSAGDGTAYTGNQPRLIVKANSAIGILTDTVLDTVSVAVGTWEQLSGTTIAATDNGVMEFIVDCDGAAGAVNCDDWSCA
jgi:hypothetical protein